MLAMTVLYYLSFLDLIGVVAWLAKLLIVVILNLIQDPLLWKRDV